MATSPSDRSIWRQPRFLTFCAAATVSVVGSEISAVALPLTAVMLGAGPMHMGILRASVSISDLLIGPLMGAGVDRVRRRPLLLVADLGRSVLLGVVPVAALLDALHIEYLLVIALLAGALTTLGKIAERSMLVSVVARHQILDANGAISTGRSVAEVVGPGLGGLLVQALSAPIAVAVDAFSFLLSAIGIRLTTVDERVNRADTDSQPRQSIWSEAGEGVRFVLGEAMLRQILIAVGIFALFDSAFFGLYVLYVSRDLGVNPGELGLIFVLGGIGGTLGAVLAGRISRRFGLGRTVVGSLIAAGAGDMLIPWVSLIPGLIVPLLGLAELVVTFGISVFMVNETTLRQQITPDEVQGRMHATIGLIVGGCNAVGAVGGGLIGEAVGVRPLLVVAATATIVSGLWLLTASVRRLKDDELPRSG